MNISPLSGINGNSPAQPLKEDPKLREACDGMEAMFLKILLKEGMQEMLENAEGHSASALGYALEQTGEEMARNSETGIADNIYEQLSANM